MKPTPANSGADLRDPDLVQALAAYMQRNALEDNTSTRKRIGNQLGYKDATAVGRYIKGNPEGDLAKFERLLRSFLENEMRIEGGGALIDDPDSFILPSVFAFLNQVRACGMINVAHGHAGTGKTCACRLYTSKHKANTLYVHVWEWTNGKSALARELVKVAGVEPKHGERNEAALARHFRDKKIMFIIDNANRLTRTARNWLADFLDYTGTPIALVGNPEISDQWRLIDQHRRRVGLHQDVSIDLFDENPEMNTSKATVKHLLKAHLPDIADNAEISRRALKIVTQPKSGSCGSFVQHARLTRMMMQGGIKDPVKAFESAETQLLAA
jgi:hypothetical protein